MEHKYNIVNPSQELIVYTVRNPPKDIERLELDFLAYGINIPFSPTGEELRGYLNVCKENNLIPFSSKKVGYDFDVKERIPKNIEGLRGFFGGGKTNEVSIEIGGFFNQERFKIFNEVLFPSLLENDYKISRGQITLWEHSSGYGPDFSININWGNKALEMVINDDYTGKACKDMSEQWFNDLKKKFSP